MSIRLLPSVLALLLAACTPVPGPAPAGPSGSAAPAAEAPASRITVEAPSAATLEVGQVQPLLVSVTYGDGKRDLAIAWEVADPTVAAIDVASGRLTGLKAGVTSVKVIATADPTRFAVVMVTVKEPTAAGEPTSAVVSPAEAELAVGAGVQLRATVTYRTGRKDAQLSWESLAPAIATVDDQGLVTGVKPGQATIRAVSDLDARVFAEARVTVR